MHELTNKIWSVAITRKCYDDTITAHMKEKAEWLKRRICVFNVKDLQLVDEAFGLEPEKTLEEKIEPLEALEAGVEYSQVGLIIKINEIINAINEIQTVREHDRKE